MNIKQRIMAMRKQSNVKKRVVSFSTFFFSIVLLLFAGSINSRSVIEESACYLTEISKSGLSTNGFTSVQISPTSKAGESKLPSTYNEDLYWQFIFRHSDFHYFSTVNGGKTHDCRYKEIDGDNITFLYSGTNYNHEYNGYYKHEVYDIVLMFRGHNSLTDGAKNFIAISKTRADELLETRGFIKTGDSYTSEQYQELLGTKTQLLFDGNETSFSISNVYFEIGDTYEKIKSTFGEFALSYINFPEGIEKEATYVFNSYDYQNYHKIERIRNYFSDNGFNISLSHYNLKDGFHEDSNKINNIIKANIGYDVFSISLIVVSVMLYMGSLAYIHLVFDTKLPIDRLVLIFLLISPISILNFINMFWRIPLLCSHFSIIFYTIYIILFIALFIYELYKKGFIKNAKINSLS